MFKNMFKQRMFFICPGYDQQILRFLMLAALRSSSSLGVLLERQQPAEVAEGQQGTDVQIIS